MTLDYSKELTKLTTISARINVMLQVGTPTFILGKDVGLLAEQAQLVAGMIDTGLATEVYKVPERPVGDGFEQVFTELVTGTIPVHQLQTDMVQELLDSLPADHPDRPGVQRAWHYLRGAEYK